MNLFSFKHNIIPREETNDQLLIVVLDGLLKTYIERVPDVQKIIDLISERGDHIINDHIAFRSIDMISMLRIFMHLGYQVKMDNTGKLFNFETKKLTAVWLKHPNHDFPRIFVSQFRFDEGSQQLQNIVSNVLKNWQDPIDSIDLNNADDILGYLQSAQWPTPTHADYQTLQKESEYISWVLYNKYYLNHFTLTVHSLESFGFESECIQALRAYQDSYKKQQSDSVIQDGVNMMHRKYKKHMGDFNQWLIEQGFMLNKPKGSTINISPDHALLQSSTKAAFVKAEFEEGVFDIPGSYAEFAYRGIMDNDIETLIKRDNPIQSLDGIARRDGFEAANADQIFESTYIGVQEKTEEVTLSSYEASCQKINTFLNQ